jgi:hypothetical protein
MRVFPQQGFTLRHRQTPARRRRHLYGWRHAKSARVAARHIIFLAALAHKFGCALDFSVEEPYLGR